MGEPHLNPWATLPFHFWTVLFFVVGSMIGSLLNVCIYRMPLGQSIITPRSHCPHCQYSIPWFLNIPLITWVYLGGRCANCKAPISVRYFLVELLTATVFMGTWLKLGDPHEIQSIAWVAALCVLLAGFIVATFIDFEHFIIPDEITIGGMVAGFIASAIAPWLHNVDSRPAAMRESVLGMIVGGAIVYAILRGGKLLFGRERVDLEAPQRLIFTETDLHLPDRVIPYDELFYRNSDTVVLQAEEVELPDRCYRDATIRFSPKALQVGDDTFDPAEVLHMEAVTSKITLPREAMGFGDVKFMAAIGAFLGWPAVIFSLMISAIIGSIVGVTLILLRRQEWSGRLPYGPYIALAAFIWIFLDPRLQTTLQINIVFMLRALLGMPYPGAVAGH